MVNQSPPQMACYPRAPNVYHDDCVEMGICFATGIQIVLFIHSYFRYNSNETFRLLAKGLKLQRENSQMILSCTPSIKNGLALIPD